MLVATLARRLGIERLVDDGVDLGDRSRGGSRGRQGHDVDVGNGAAWAAGAGWSTSIRFVGETFGRSKLGAACGYTRVRGCHPILATRADTGEVLHIRLRKDSANTSRGFARVWDELPARVARPDRSRCGRTGASGTTTPLTGSTTRVGDARSACGRSQRPARRSKAIDETAWQTQEDYPDTSIVETTLGGRGLIVRRIRTLDRQGQLLPSGECSRS